MTTPQDCQSSEMMLTLVPPTSEMPDLVRVSGLWEKLVSTALISVQEAPTVEQPWLLPPLSTSRQLLKESAVSRKVWVARAKFTCCTPY